MNMGAKPRILVITPVRHIEGVSTTLESFADVTYLDDPSYHEVKDCIADYHAIYTNPNKSKVFIDGPLLDSGKNLKVVCTASTGTTHIDKNALKERKIPLISLTEERAVIERISSTAELAFTLTMTAIRKVLPSHRGALKGEWDYTKYIGRQMNGLTIGVVGYGRLGSMYARYCLALGSKVVIYDPFKTVAEKEYRQVNSLETLARESDVIAAHVHATEANHKMFNATFFSWLKPTALFVNTARGEVVCEESLVAFLKKNPQSQAAVDVLYDEVRNRSANPLLCYAKESDQVIITQHIGGMSVEAQEIAFGHAASLLKRAFT